MKWFRIIIPILLLAVILATPSAVMAADPGDGVDVDISVVTPGDVNLDVGIDAGGDVDVIVDGMDIRGEIAGLHRGVNEANEVDGSGGINTGDWYRYWYKEMTPFAGTLDIMAGNLGLTMDGLAKLIQERDTDSIVLSTIISRLNAHDSQFNNGVKSMGVEVENHSEELLNIQSEFGTQVMSLEERTTLLEEQLALEQSNTSTLMTWCIVLASVLGVVTLSLGYALYAVRRRV